MSEHRIPSRADAGIQFLGVDVSDAVPVIAGVFIALMFGSLLGWVSYFIIPAIGWGLSKAWIAWKKVHPAGHFDALLYSLGISGYSEAFNRKNKIFVGDSVVINPARNRLFDLTKKKD